MYVVLETVSFKYLGYPGGSVSQAVGLHSLETGERGGREAEREREQREEGTTEVNNLRKVWRQSPSHLSPLSVTLSPVKYE